MENNTQNTALSRNDGNWKKSTMKPPIRYYGGKGGMYNKILPFFPDKSTYNIYVEPFAGSFIIGFKKPMTEVEIYNDSYKSVYALYKVLSDKEMYEEFKAKCDLVHYSKDIREENLKKLETSDLSMVERAFAFFYVNRTSHNGNGGLSMNTAIRRNMSKSVSDMLSAIDKLPELHERLSRVMVTNDDGVSLIRKYDKPNVMIYADPPYVHETRGSARYPEDMTTEKHKEFLEVCKDSKAKILISGYDNELYEQHLVSSGWHKQHFLVNTTSNSFKPKTKIETLWWNYDLSAK